MTRVSRQKGVKFEQRAALPNPHGKARVRANKACGKKQEAPALPRPLVFRFTKIQSSGQRHQLKRQTSDEVTVWTNFSEWTNSVGSRTPPLKSWLSLLL